jgi:hypothetical protein
VDVTEEQSAHATEGAVPDFEREGLLKDLQGAEREARLELLRELAAAGVGVEVSVHAARSA